MSLLRLVLKTAVPLPKLENFSRYLFIGPHPDDIEIGAGATVSKLASMGKEISFLICLDGRYGLGNAPDGTTPEELVNIRKEEAIASAKVMGVDDVHFLDFCDGGFYDLLQVRTAIAIRVGVFKPDVIFAVDPDVPNECHVDHLNIGRECKIVAKLAPFKEIMERYGAQTSQVKAIALYMTAKPNRYVITKKEHLEKQIQAMKTNKSQFPEGCKDLAAVTTYLKLRSLFFGLRRFRISAEGCRVIDALHMHCFPEEG